MKSVKDIKQSIKKLKVESSDEIHSRILDKLLRVLDRSKKRTTAIHPNIWKQILKSRITKIAAAAGIILVSLVLWQKASFTSKVYAITDVPIILKNSKNVYLQGDHYFNLTHKGEKVPPEPVERWIDFENERARFTNIRIDAGPEEVQITRGETIINGRYMLKLNHREKTAVFYKMSDFHKRIDVYFTFQDMFGRLFGEIENYNRFKKVGQENLDSVSYDIWEAKVEYSTIERSEMYRYWLSPVSGQSGRFQSWYRNRSEEWRLGNDYYKIEHDIDIPEDVFSLDVPEGYEAKNTKETARILEFDKGGLSGDGSLFLDPRISFTLKDGSVILAWRSFRRDSKIPNSEFFKNLEFGGTLPKLPREIYGLKAISESYETTYIGYHLAHTRKGEKWFEWSVYIPDKSPPPYGQIFEYELLERLNPPPGHPSLMENQGITINCGLTIETSEDFNKWIIGAMVELSDDDQAPRDMTYNRVLQLIQQIKDLAIKKK